MPQPVVTTKDDDFLWGSATSAYQVEGGNKWCDWYKWEQKRGIEPCGDAVKHYEKFADDFALAKSFGQNAHRLSLEWSRLEPQAGKYALDEFGHYKEVLHKLKQLNLKVCLTLNHFTLPQWLAHSGGWENPDSIKYFEKYVHQVVKELGGPVDLWVTINEPLVLATEAYLYGHWPPQARSLKRMTKVLRNLAKAHQAAYDIIHSEIPQAKVGLAHNFFSLEPLRPWLVLDRLASRRADRFWNKWIMDLTGNSHDFLGVNYYFHQRAFLSFNIRRGFVGFADPKKLGREVSALGWEVNPDGLRQVLVNLWQRYKLPIYVTENGIAATDEQQRDSFIERSVRSVAEAQAGGVGVRGYFYWSLLDNFEWAMGFGPKFGLIEVERKTFERRPRSAAEVYARLCNHRA